MSYRESQEQIFEAEAALKAGDVDRARASFREAARLQRAFVDSLPPARVRTRSVYGLSAASLLYKAGDLDEAERLAGRLLGEDWLEAHSADGLRELLVQVWTERSDPGRLAVPKRRTTPKLPPMTNGRRLAPHRGGQP